MARKNHKNRRPQKSKRSFHAHLPEASMNAPRIVRCPTGKTGFPLHIAEAKVEKYQNSTRHSKPVRFYPCEQCDSYHLTSQEKR